MRSAESGVIDLICARAPQPKPRSLVVRELSAASSATVTSCLCADVVQTSGSALRLATDLLASARWHSRALRDHFARYADCLLAEVLQTVACNTAHAFDALGSLAANPP